MSILGYRLSANEAHAFGGHQIDRNTPLTFSLNGIEVSGFAGDTILSALLGAGINSVGTHLGRALALDDALGLLVYPTDKSPGAEDWLPIDRTPAVNGAAFTTMHPPKSNTFAQLAAKLRKVPVRTLGIDCALLQPRLDLLVSEVEPELIEADVMIIGGGLAGLTAAMLASNAGKSVVVVERRRYLGGDAILFGQTGDEEAPEIMIEKLTETLLAAANVTLMTATNAISARDGIIIAHGLDLSGPLPQGRFYRLMGAATVIATGAEDQLPVFAGNRLPGIVGLATAFHLSSAFGVWAGPNVAIATGNNAAYRFARMGHDSGATIAKIVDNRLVPQSRYIEFSKAYGMKSESGLRLENVTQDDPVGPYTINFARSWEGGSGGIEPLDADAVIISGGWLPRLSLWQQLGGHIDTDPETLQLLGTDGPANIILAGACAGCSSTMATIDSGVGAIEEILGRPVRAVLETEIDPAFETPDGPLPVSTTASDIDAPAYLSGGRSLIAASAPIPPKSLMQSLFGSGPELDQASTLGQALELGDLAALMMLGTLVPAEFGAVVNERAVLAREFEPALPPVQITSEVDTTLDTLVPYLQGRFGAGAARCEILMEDGPTPEVGSLIFANSDISEPTQAIGTVVVKSAASGRGSILLQKQFYEAGRRVSVRGMRGPAAAIVLQAPTS